ncbi:MAG: hypothetical protein AAGI50_03860 [Pseudomonadota bacterium]
MYDAIGLQFGHPLRRVSMPCGSLGTWFSGLDIATLGLERIRLARRVIHLPRAPRVEALRRTTGC